MLNAINNLLSHYANRVGVTCQPHPKGMQLTVSVMPCPLKVKDESLRQELVNPIVLVGSEAELTEQLNELMSGLTVAQDNPVIEKSVSDYLTSVASAKGKQATTQSKSTSNKADVSAETSKTATKNAKEDTVEVADELDAFF